MIYLFVFLLIIIITFWILKYRFTDTEALLIVVSAVIFTEWNVQIGSSARVTVYDLLILLCIGVWLKSLVENKMKISMNNAVLISLMLIFLLIFWCCVTWIIHPGNPSIIYAGWKAYRLSTFLIYPILGVQLACTNKNFQKKILYILLFGGLINGIIGIVQTFSNGRYLSGIYTNHRFLGLFSPLPRRWLMSMTGGIIFTEEQFAGFAYRGHGTFLDVTWYSPFMLVMVCLWMGFLFHSKTRHEFWMAIFGVSTCIMAIILSATRGGFIALIVVLGVLLVVKLKKVLYITYRSSIILFVSFLLVMPIYFGGTHTPTRFFSVFQAVYRLKTTFNNENVQIQTFNGRSELWSLVLRRWYHSPIVGTGEEIFASDIHWQGSDGYNVPLHNQFLFFLYYNGLIALMVFCIIYFIFTLSSFYLAKKEGLDGIVGMGWLLSLIGLSINGMVSDWLGFASTSTGALFFLIGMFVVSRLSLTTKIRIVN